MKSKAEQVVDELLEADPDVNPEEFMQGFAQSGFQPIEWDEDMGWMKTSDVHGKEIKYDAPSFTAEFGASDDKAHGRVEFSYFQGYPYTDRTTQKTYKKYWDGKVSITLYDTGLRAQKRERRRSERWRAANPGQMDFNALRVHPNEGYFNSEWNLGVTADSVEDYKDMFMGLIKSVLLPLLNERDESGNPLIFPMDNKKRARIATAISDYFAKNR